MTKEVKELAKLIASIDMPCNGWCVARARLDEAEILAKAIIDAGYSRKENEDD